MAENTFPPSQLTQPIQSAQTVQPTQPVQPAGLTSARPDAFQVIKWNTRLKNVRGEFQNLAKTTPGFDSVYITELLAKLDQGVEYSKNLAALSLSEVPDITKTLQSLRPRPVVMKVNDVKSLESMLTYISACHRMDPQTLDLFMDLEGDMVNGGLSMIQVFLNSRNTAYVIDVLSLGGLTFTTSSADGSTLKQILESPIIFKAFFDIKGDSHEMYACYGVRVAGIVDLQLYAIAAYGGAAKEKAPPLEMCVKNNTNCDLSERERKEWKEIKDWGKARFEEAEAKITMMKNNEDTTVGWVPVFNQRPLRDDVLAYAVQDVTVLPIIHRHALAALSKMKNGAGDEWRARIEEETVKRIQASQSVEFEGYQKGKGDFGVPAWKGIN